MKKTALDLSQRYPVKVFVRDLPNLCSLSGLLCSVMSMYFSLVKNYPGAMMGMLLAVLFDYWDGMIARRIKHRDAVFSSFGGQLDSLIDMVSFSVCPCLLLLCFGEFLPWILPVAGLTLSSAALRLSYFNVFGLTDKGFYTGLSLDNNIFILSFVFLFKDWFAHSSFLVFLCVLFTGLSLLNLAPVKTPKYEGRWYYLVLLYVAVLVCLYGRQIFIRG